MLYVTEHLNVCNCSPRTVVVTIGQFVKMDIDNLSIVSGGTYCLTYYNLVNIC